MDAFQFYRALRIIATALTFFLLPQHNALSQGAASIRQVVASCWQHGAINEFMMLQCTGLDVSPPVFMSCMNGGPCFGEPGSGGGTPGPACGVAGLPFCPQPSPCGYADTIPCPPGVGFPLPPFPVALACGAPPFPPCVVPQLCGRPTTFACPGAGPDWSPRTGAGVASFNAWQPTLQIALPGTGQVQRGQNAGTIRFAEPIVPDLDALERCRTSASDEDEFMSCMISDAFPSSYKMTRACMEAHSDDAGAAFLCSTGDKDIQQTYERVKQVQECASEASSKIEVANCVGDQVLGQNERYYANCLARNSQNASAALVCGLAKDLSPEQQIALNCAITTGGEPHAFAACVGGELTQREITKCWDYGIATEQGCFGPNNEIRKYWNTADNTLKHAFGENSVAYQAFTIYKDNVAVPGPGHEVVRALNTAINDLKNGPSESNDIYKATQVVSGAVQSVGEAVGNAIGLKF